MKRDGSASDKRNGEFPSAPPPLPQTATPVDEPIAGEPQNTPSSKISTLMTEVLDKENLKRALERVKRNKGAPGIDGMSVDELSVHLKAHWPSIHAQLVAGSYCPQPVRRVEIPKPDGRKRLLGIPTVVDRLTVNAQKSAVDRPRNRKFLGFTVSRAGARIKVADSAIDKLKAKIRELTRRTRGHRLSDIVQELKTALTGWVGFDVEVEAAGDAFGEGTAFTTVSIFGRLGDRHAGHLTDCSNI